MSDRESAEFYQQYKDDAEVWGEDESVSAQNPQRPLGATITVRLSADDAALLRRAAKALDVGYSGVVRKALESFLRPKYTIESGVVVSDLMSALKESVRTFQKSMTLETPQPDTVTGRPEHLAKSA
jgi:hypothetical protein